MRRLDSPRSSGAAEAKRRASLGFGGLFVAIFWWRVGLERVHQASGHRCDFLHGLIEGDQDATARFTLIADLAYVLEGGGEHLLIGGRRLEVEQRANVPAHGPKHSSLDAGARGSCSG